MVNSTDLIDTDLTFDEFEHLAANIPKRPGATSDDQVAVVDGPEYGNHSHTQLCDIMPTRFPLTEELTQRYKSYLVLSQTPH